MNKEEHTKYQFFICYTRDSAEDLAIHLWEGLKKRRFNAFLDLKDIPKKFKKTDEWRKLRDEALCNSETVLFVIAHGFEKSEEVRNEISLAFDEEKDLILLRHRDLGCNIMIDLKDKKINLGNYNQISFDTKEELLRKVLSASDKEKIKQPYLPLIEREKIQKGEVKTKPFKEGEIRKRALLPDNTQITKLEMDDILLDRIYKQAHRKAIGIYDDAQLSGFTIQVFPFKKDGPMVCIYLDFYSKWADRLCKFQYCDLDLAHELKHSTPDKRPTTDSQREAFTTLPWKMSPRWMQFLSRAYDKIKPLPSVELTIYHLFAYPTRQIYWEVTFEDGLSGNDYHFEWDGRRLDENSIKQVR